jgi:hypothetical protein
MGATSWCIFVGLRRGNGLFEVLRATACGVKSESKCPEHCARLRIVLSYARCVLDDLVSSGGWLAVAAGGVLLAVALYALHRFLNWLTRDRPRDYTRRGSAGLGNALLEVHSLLEPDRKNLLEAKLVEQVEESESGDPPPV